MSNVLDEMVAEVEPMPELISVVAASNRPVLLGLDIGTSGIRAALFDEQGGELEGASVRISSRQARFGDFGLLDADDLVEEVADVLDALFARLYGSTTPVELMSVSCFWHSLMGVDEEGRATTPVFSWADSRSAAAADELRSEFDEASVHARTGCRFHSSYWPAKLRRLKTEEPETFAATKRWWSFADYLTQQLFGDSATSVSMASGTGLLHQHTCEWEMELLSALDIGVESLPEIASPGRVFQGLSRRFALRWPQLAKARLYPTIGDGAANNIGAGCYSKEKIGLMVGTSGAMRMLYEGEPPRQLPPELWCYRADRKRVVVGGALSDGGGLYNWIKESLLYDHDSELVENELELLEPDSHGLTILPFWAGERSTGWNSNARGAILGLTMQTRPIEILRASLEAIAYRFALIARALEPLAPEAVFVASGHALRSSPAWVQILADVLGRPVSVCESAEASTRGAALLALEAAGKIQNIEQFSAPLETVVEPNLQRHAQYLKGLERQQQAYERIIRETGTGR